MRNATPPVDPAEIARLLGGDGERALLRLARESVRCAVTGEAPDRELFERCSDLEMFGCFVTLKTRTTLRGCIGMLGHLAPVRDLVRRSARSSALSDPRFPAVSAEELETLSYELSLLTPLTALETESLPDSIVIGRDGLVVEDSPQRGLLLPQVATEWNWNARQFLEETCHKAGLPPDAWRRGATVSRFSALVID